MWLQIKCPLVYTVMRIFRSVKRRVDTCRKKDEGGGGKRSEWNEEREDEIQSKSVLKNNQCRE
jgi:hypothetical protein